jgi:hypothetical protein
MAIDDMWADYLAYPGGKLQVLKELAKVMQKELIAKKAA